MGFCATRARIVCSFILVMLVIPPLMAQDASWLTDVTASAGLQDLKGFRIYTADLDGDDYPDIVFQNGINTRNQLSVYMNRPRPGSNDPHDRVFVDFTEESNVNVSRDPELEGRQTELVSFGDIDNDGDLDMAAGVWYWDFSKYNDKGDRHEILLNDGAGRFTLYENSNLPELGLVPLSQMAFLDYDVDGNIDLCLGTFSLNHQANQFGPDILLRGNGDGSFTDVTAAAGMSNVRFPLYGLNVTDWNNDGWQDIITSPYCRSGGSLWHNNGDGTFTDMAGPAVYSAQHMRGDNGQPMCQWEALPADFDNDGDMDLAQILVHGGADLGEGRSTLAINQGPESGYRYKWDLNRLRRTPPFSDHFGDQDALWFDLNNDGLLDLVISQSVYRQATDRMFVFLQYEDHTFDDITAELDLVTPIKATHAMEPLDFDLDGDDDLLLAMWRGGSWEPENRDRVVLLRNDAAHANNWLAVKLQTGGRMNRAAIGARVTVHSGELAQMREIQAGRGHFGGQQPFILNFGLGQAQSVDSVTVRWPIAGFPTSTIYDPPVNNLISIAPNAAVAVKEFAPAADLHLTPNPARDRLFVTLPSTFTSQLSTVEIVSNLGRSVQRRTLRPGQRRLDMNLLGLPAGAYHLRIGSADGTVVASRFVKSR